MPDKFIEKIVIKPSTELTADEYEHFKEETANIAVHIFTSDDEDDQSSAALLIETLKAEGYKMDEANRHSLGRDNFLEVQKKICDDSKDSGGLILFISGISEDDGTIPIFNGQGWDTIPLQEVVTKFTSYSCTELKNKPKIFIFNMRSFSATVADSRRLVRPAYSYDLTYDTPGEADMLIVYKKSENGKSKEFISKLCDKVKQHGKEEDIVSLVTCLDVHKEESRPLMISTLTKKFYVTNSNHRDHHYHIRCQEELNQQLEDIKRNLLNTNSSKKTMVSKNAGTGAIKKVVKSKSSSNKAVSVKDSVNTNTKRPTSLIESDSGWSGSNGAVRGSRTLAGSTFRLGLRIDSILSTETEGSKKRVTSVSKSNDAKPRWK